MCNKSIIKYIYINVKLYKTNAYSKKNNVQG